jgi:hypothetical protein
MDAIGLKMEDWKIGKNVPPLANRPDANELEATKIRIRLTLRKFDQTLIVLYYAGTVRNTLYTKLLRPY